MEGLGPFIGVRCRLKSSGKGRGRSREALTFRG